MTDTLEAGAVQAPAAGPRRITTPGVYPGLTAEEYHADPIEGGSLSSTGARKLLPPSCPALFRHEQDNPPAPKKTFEFGHAAHKLVLGEGPDLVRIDATEWRSNAVKAEVAAVRDAGGVPLKPAEYDQVQAMADAIRHHPIAGPLFTPGQGVAEQSLFWRDGRTGAWLRARPDWVKHRTPGKRLILADYKTCRSAEPDAIERDVHAYGYHQQAAWYLTGAVQCDLAEPDGQAGMVFVFQEKTAPYLVTVVELAASALRIGSARNRAAIDLYEQCRTSGRWPGYSDGIAHISLPVWAEIRDTEEYL